MDIVLEFERPILELRKRIEQLRALQDAGGVNLLASIDQLEEQADRLQERVYARLTPWQRTMLARHPFRPFTLDYVECMFTEWTELHGDRAGFDDPAIVCGMARFRGRPVMVIGHQKGRNTKENIHRNFGMARPDGYRKALRVMKLAHDFNMPILTFIDTPGAYPGVEAEERGQAEAIARNIIGMSRFRVPIVTVVTGEGGSGGALAVGVANRVLMLENSIYSVISPEGCAAILWRDRAEGPRAAAALRVTAHDCLRFGVVDEVIDEPPGGAHRNREKVIASVADAIGRHLDDLLGLDGATLVADRHARFRDLGVFEELAIVDGVGG